VIAPAEASSNLARYDEVVRPPRHIDHGDGITEISENPRRRVWSSSAAPVMIGTYVLSAGRDAYFGNRARRVRTSIKRDFEG
jgi:aspartyl-tRNA(Asn)/glutamyl-tRNA(Gln) amidotransferase subunit A